MKKTWIKLMEITELMPKKTSEQKSSTHKRNIAISCNLIAADTLPKTNIAPENRPSQKETNIPTIHFQVRAVGLREGNILNQAVPLRVSLPRPGFSGFSSMKYRNCTNQSLNLKRLKGRIRDSSGKPKMIRVITWLCLG